VPLGDFFSGKAALEFRGDPGAEFLYRYRGSQPVEMVPIEVDGVVQILPVGFENLYAGGGGDPGRLRPASPPFR